MLKFDAQRGYYDDQTGEQYVVDMESKTPGTLKKTGENINPGMVQPSGIKPEPTGNNIVDLIRKLYPSQQDTASYRGTVGEGYANFDHANDPNINPVTHQIVTAFASDFADNVFKKTGRLPTEQQIKDFVVQNVTPINAEKYVKQSLNHDQRNMIVEDYLKGNPDALADPGAKSAEEQRIAGLTGQLDKIYDLGRENLVKSYDQDVYNPAKTTAVNDLSGQGMLSQPNSRYILDAIEANRGRDISSGLNTLESNRASGNIDITKTIQDILERNKDRNMAAYQFGKSFNANRDDTFFNQGLQRRQLDIASQIGRLQAGQKGNGLSGALGGGLSGAATGAAVGSVVPGLGTALGAGIGGLAGLGLGYFGSRG